MLQLQFLCLELVILLDQIYVYSDKHQPFHSSFHKAVSLQARVYAPFRTDTLTGEVTVALE